MAGTIGFTEFLFWSKLSWFVSVFVHVFDSIFAGTYFITGLWAVV
jgi:hypothetical protein